MSAQPAGKDPAGRQLDDGEIIARVQGMAGFPSEGPKSLYLRLYLDRAGRSLPALVDVDTTALGTALRRAESTVRSWRDLLVRHGLLVKVKGKQYRLHVPPAESGQVTVDRADQQGRPLLDGQDPPSLRLHGAQPVAQPPTKDKESKQERARIANPQRVKAPNPPQDQTPKRATAGVARAEDLVPDALAKIIGELNAAADPNEQRKRLYDRALAACPELHERTVYRGREVDSTYLAGRLADLVVLYSMPIRDYARVLQDLAAMRVGEKGLENPGGFFNSKVTALWDKRDQFRSEDS